MNSKQISDAPMTISSFKGDLILWKIFSVHSICTKLHMCWVVPTERFGTWSSAEKYQPFDLVEAGEFGQAILPNCHIPRTINLGWRCGMEMMYVNPQAW